MINALMESKKITKYRLAKNSGVPYTTINDICNGKAKIEKCSAETIYRISKTLGVSMESIIEPALEKRMKNGKYEEIYSSIKNEEKQSQEILIDFEKTYENVANASNVDDILRTLKTKL